MGALAPIILKNRLLAPAIFGHLTTVGKKRVCEKYHNNTQHPQYQNPKYAPKYYYIHTKWSFHIDSKSVHIGQISDNSLHTFINMPTRFAKDSHHISEAITTFGSLTRTLIY